MQTFPRTTVVPPLTNGAEAPFGLSRGLDRKIRRELRKTEQIVDVEAVKKPLPITIFVSA